MKLYFLHWIIDKYSRELLDDDWHYEEKDENTVIFHFDYGEETFTQGQDKKGWYVEGDGEKAYYTDLVRERRNQEFLDRCEMELPGEDTNELWKLKGKYFFYTSQDGFFEACKNCIEELGKLPGDEDGYNAAEIAFYVEELFNY